MRGRVAVLVVGAAGLAAGLFVLWPVETRISDPVEARPADAAPSATSRDVARPGDANREPPSSLVGTNEDGALVVDAAGRFVPTADAIDLFDYYLSATGEESSDLIRERILHAIRSKLAGDAARAAEGLLDDYLEYRNRAGRLFSDRLVGEDLERRIQYIRELRREIFGTEVAEALFEAEEARWFSDLERRRIMTDPSLTPKERDRRLAAVASEEPESLRSVREQALAHRDLRLDEAALRTEGAGAAEIDQLREERFGRDAASRLSQLDDARARWQERIDVYRRDRDRSLAGASQAEYEKLLEQVRANHFDSNELVRIRALDRLEAPPSQR